MLYSRISGEPLLVPESFDGCPERTVCITGHRENGIIPYHGDIAAASAGVRVFLYHCIRMAVQAGYDSFFSGLAEGTDLRAAEIVLKMRMNGADVRLLGAMPYLRHADRFSERSRRLLGIVEKNADKLILINSDPDMYYSRTPGPHSSSTLYRDRNYFMVDNSSAVIAFLNRDGRHSGTEQTVNYASRMGRKIVRFSMQDVHRALDRAGGDPRRIVMETEMPENPFEYPF